jgi:CheY-like chemotaxis protein
MGDNHVVTTILIVEDEPAHAELIETKLRRGGLGNPIVHLPDGQAALDCLRSQGSYADRDRDASLLMLLDLNMPGVDGAQVLAEVKADAALRKIPVIVLTSTDDPGEVESAYDLGCNAYVTKPVPYDQFVGTIRSLGQFVTLLAVPKHG